MYTLYSHVYCPSGSPRSSGRIAPITVSCGAMTLVEALTVIVILGIVLFITLPNLTNTKSVGEENAAKAKAAALNMAKDSFLSVMGGPQATNPSLFGNNWTIDQNWQVANDDDRFTWVRGYLSVPNANSVTLNTYRVPGYLLVFHANIAQPTLLYRDNNLNGALETATDSSLAY